MFLSGHNVFVHRFESWLNRTGCDHPSIKSHDFSRCLGLTRNTQSSCLSQASFKSYVSTSVIINCFLFVHRQIACCHDSYKDQLHIWVSIPRSRLPGIMFSESNFRHFLIADTKLPYWGAHLTVRPSHYVPFHSYMDIRTVILKKKYYPFISQQKLLIYLAKWISYHASEAFSEIGWQFG